MKANWEKVISANMDALEFPGREKPLYRPKGAKGSVMIVTDLGDFPPVCPPMDHHDAMLAGGRELLIDASDPDFLIVQKIIGIHDYLHCIPWDKVVDFVFYQVDET